jgi:low affinity Fe/Cu permease
MKKKNRLSRLLEDFSTTVTRWTGGSLAFATAAAIIVIWGVSGPIFGFSDTWQLVINTGTTIVTFLMVFLIQNTQNRDSEALQIKIDELIRATEGAHNALLDLEEIEGHEFDKIRMTYSKLAKQARADLREGMSDTGCPALEEQR